MTYAVLASNPKTKEIGIAATTVTINASRVWPFPHRLLPEWSERGLICQPQASMNPHNAYKMFELWDAGMKFKEIEFELSRYDKHWSQRQVGAVSAGGEVFVHTGSDVLRTTREGWDHANHITGDGWVAMGNYMNGPQPVMAMAEVLKSNQDLPMDERLMRAIEAGRDAGGQADPHRGPIPELHARMLVFNGRQPWPAVDLRVDLDLHAVAKLRRLLTHTKRLDHMLWIGYTNPAEMMAPHEVVFEIQEAQI
jgi:uncharacterized Ntn-hydrolase superfamily protein